MAAAGSQIQQTYSLPSAPNLPIGTMSSFDLSTIVARLKSVVTSLSMKAGPLLVGFIARRQTWALNHGL